MRVFRPPLLPVHLADMRSPLGELGRKILDEEALTSPPSSPLVAVWNELGWKAILGIMVRIGAGIAGGGEVLAREGVEEEAGENESAGGRAK